MNQRICRHLTSCEYKVKGYVCKVFLEPMRPISEAPTLITGKPWIWNVGFVAGKSTRQVNDWFKNRKNKRTRGLKGKIVGKEGIALISKGFKEVLKIRWNIPAGDSLVLDCTSGDPERQFHAWSRWHKYHPEWVIDEQEKKFYWFRPPYASDSVWQSCKEQNLIPIGQVPTDPLSNTHKENYFCFNVFPTKN